MIQIPESEQYQNVVLNQWKKDQTLPPEVLITNGLAAELLDAYYTDETPHDLHKALCLLV
jgi:hypothetical protein